MKIISKRRRKVSTGINERVIHVEHEEIGIIIEPGEMTPDERERAERAMKELRKRLEEIDDILRDGWYNSNDC